MRLQCMNLACKHVFDSTDIEGQLTVCPACEIFQTAVKAFDGITPLTTTIAGKYGRESKGDGSKEVG